MNANRLLQYPLWAAQAAIDAAVEVDSSLDFSEVLAGMLAIWRSVGPNDGQKESVSRVLAVELVFASGRERSLELVNVAADSHERRTIFGCLLCDATVVGLEQAIASGWDDLRVKNGRATGYCKSCIEGRFGHIATCPPGHGD